MDSQLDAFDYAILRIIQRDNLLPEKTIAEQVILSTTAVHRRIRKMRLSGIIEGNVALINPDRVGQHITLCIEVSLKDVHYKATDAAKNIFLSIPQIQQCYHVTGDADFILLMTLSSMVEYMDINRSLFETNSNIKGVKTFVTIDRVKTGQTLTI